jgi:hypothetical protein
MSPSNQDIMGISAECLFKIFENQFQSFNPLNQEVTL